MNFVLKTVAASMVMLTASVSGVHAAGAGTGTITFEGEILEAACSIQPDSVDQTVPLGQVAKSQLSTGGITSPESFQIELTGCALTALTDKTVTATFTGAASTEVAGALGISGTAGGAGIMMVDGAGAPIVLGTPTRTQLLQTGDNTLVFGAYLKGKPTGDITPGAFSAVTNFSLAYQ